MNNIDIIAALIGEDHYTINDFFAAVACVEYRGKWLLGLSTARDDRFNKWCMPGGGIEDGETLEWAAIRECREESGVLCKSMGRAFILNDCPGVAFVHCKALGSPLIDHNSEFSDMRFFSPREMKSLNLFHNVQEIINRL